MEDAVITKNVNERYARAVTTGEEMCCPTGYDHDDLRTFIPECVLKVSYGCGTPVGLSTAQLGETVLDIGSGGGIDCFEASRRVGSNGQVIGIDMTDEMLALARSQAPIVAQNLGYGHTNVDFRKGQAEAMPVDDSTVDLIVSNCVINLAPDKSKVFSEMYRVLNPGGRFTISDIVADQPIPQYLQHDKEKWGDCLSGALPLSEYWNGLHQAGFLGIHHMNLIPWRIIDGIHFVSVTLTGFKLPTASEAGPVKFESVDLIVSNCVINLAPDKSKVFSEMYRVLNSGGRFTISLKTFDLSDLVEGLIASRPHVGLAPTVRLLALI